AGPRRRSPPERHDARCGNPSLFPPLMVIFSNLTVARARRPRQAPWRKETPRTPPLERLEVAHYACASIFPGKSRRGNNKMKQLRIGDIAIDAVIEREGP